MAESIKNITASLHQRLLNKARLTNAPESFGDVIAAVKVFLEPLEVSFGKRRTFRSTWTAPGPWQ